MTGDPEMETHEGLMDTCSEPEVMNQGSRVGSGKEPSIITCVGVKKKFK